MALTKELVVEKLQQKFTSSILKIEDTYNMPTFFIKKEQISDVLYFLKTDTELQFIFLTDICGAHYPNRKNEELEVIYHLHNLVSNIRIRLKVLLPVKDPKIASATAHYKAADWMERETFDFYGIQFIGHHNLKRILNVDEMDFYPLRKEYPLEEQTRVDKDDSKFGR